MTSSNMLILELVGARIQHFRLTQINIRARWSTGPHVDDAQLLHADDAQLQHADDGQLLHADDAQLHAYDAQLPC